MSQQNVELVRRVVDSYNAGELPWDLIDPEVEWVIDPVAFTAGTYRGHAGVRDLLATLAEAFDRVEFHFDEYLDTGDQVVGLGRSMIHGQRSGITTGQPVAYTFRLRDGRIVAARSYLNASEALEAAGLRE